MSACLSLIRETARSCPEPAAYDLLMSTEHGRDLGIEPWWWSLCTHHTAEVRSLGGNLPSRVETHDPDRLGKVAPRDV